MDENYSHSIFLSPLGIVFTMATVEGVERYLIVILICTFLMTYDVEHVNISHLYISSREMPIQIFCPLKIWVFFLLSYKRYLYILDINPLSDV